MTLSLHKPFGMDLASRRVFSFIGAFLKPLYDFIIDTTIGVVNPQANCDQQIIR